MLCPACEGEGCDKCIDGHIDVKECPLKEITEDIWQLIELASLYAKGLPPVAGGALDQSASFIAAFDFVTGEERYWKNKLRIPE